MSMEAALLHAIIIIATGAAIIKFALFEWEGVVRAWRRATRKPRRETNLRA